MEVSKIPSQDRIHQPPSRAAGARSTDRGADRGQGRRGDTGGPAIMQFEFQQSKSYENMKEPQIQFIVMVPDIPFATQ